MQLNQSVRKAITLLRTTADHGEGASVSALARAAGLPRATALRLIRTMEAEGLLLRVPDADRVVLGPELLRLARDADVGTLLLDLARGRLADLCAEVRETVTLSVVAPDGGLDVVYQADGPQHLVVRSWTGLRFPLHASSSGKVLLAGYDEARLRAFLRRPLEPLTPSTITTARALRRELAHVREQGFATSADELEEGLASVSLGVRDDSGSLVGVVNVTGLSQRFDAAARARAVARVRPLVAEVEAALGRRA